MEVASKYFRSDKISIGSDTVYAAEEYLTGVWNSTHCLFLLIHAYSHTYIDWIICVSFDAFMVSLLVKYWEDWLRADI